MSEVYEAAVFHAEERTARRIFVALSSPLRLRLIRLAGDVFGIYRVAGRDHAFGRHAVERIAQQASAEAGRAVAVFYDNRSGIRAGVLYAASQRVREFGEADAWWVPCGQDGEPLLDGPRFRASELHLDEEYECIFSAIDAALQAVEAGPALSVGRLKQAFCYEEFEALAESGDPT
jgi:hypothetical protein